MEAFLAFAQGIQRRRQRARPGGHRAAQGPAPDEEDGGDQAQGHQAIGQGPGIALPGRALQPFAEPAAFDGLAFRRGNFREPGLDHLL